METIELTQEFVADNLLWGLWHSIDESYKEKYFQEVWEHFENAIKSASYTNSLKKFLSNIKNRIPLTIQAKFNKDILKIVESGKDEIILNWLRAETTYLVMICRVRNQERKELLKLEEKENENIYN
jgi:hypothetical protein